MRFLWSVTALASLASPPAILAGGDGSFRGPQIFNVGNPAAVAAGDFNGDGKLDLASVNGTSQITILLQDPSNRVEWTRLTQTAGNGNFFLRAVDIDADGDDDLAMADPAGVAYVLLSSGDGTFQAGDPLTQARGSRAVAAGDWNGDGKLDLATANHSRLNVSVFLGGGDGKFTHHRTYDAAGEPHAIESVDFDGDGLLDLMVGLSEYGLQPFRGRPEGQFEPRAPTLNLGCVRSLSAGDLNGDGRVDLMAACHGEAVPGLSVGQGVYGPCLEKFTASACALADLNSDGALDIVSIDPPRAGLTARLGKGNGSFHPAASFSSPGLGSNCIVSGDLDGDGRVEVISADIRSSSLTVFWGSDEEQLFESGYSVTGAGPARALAVADLDGDGFPDLFLARSDQPQVQVSLRPGGTSAPPPPPLVIRTVHAFTWLEAVDLDADGVPDLAGTQITGGLALVALLGPSGEVRSQAAMPAGVYPTAVVAGPVDEGETVDLVVPCSGSSHLAVFPGLGEGAFGEVRRVPSLKRVKDAALGDLDRDGIPDLALISTEALATQLGRGGGEFSEPVIRIQDLQRRFSDVAVADLDRDGAPDILASDTSLLGVLHLPGDGRGGFGEARLHSLRADPVSLRLADLNGDGLLDITTGDKTRQSVSVLLNRVGGEFSAASIGYRIDSAVLSHRLADLDRDGSLDVIALAGGGATVEVLPGRQAAPPGNAFRRGDVDSDGRIELSDPIAILRFFFFAGERPSCEDAADANDDGRVDLTDPIAILDRLFQGGAPLPRPGPTACGHDPRPDKLADCLAACQGG